jgi:hypothetical protein
MRAYGGNSEERAVKWGRFNVSFAKVHLICRAQVQHTEDRVWLSSGAKLFYICLKEGFLFSSF